MKSREYYEEELKSLESIDTSPEGIKRVEIEIQGLEDKQRKAREDKAQGITGTGLNNAERHRLKELRAMRGRMERKEELEVLLNMNGIEEFTQEAQLDGERSAQQETLDMINEMIGSNAERAANEATGARTEKDKTFRGKIPQKEGYYNVAVPTQLTKLGEVRARKPEMSKNSLLGASVQLAALEALSKREGLTPEQQNMIEKLTRYFDKVLETLKEEDRQFAEQVQAQEGPEEEIEDKRDKNRDEQEDELDPAAQAPAEQDQERDVGNAGTSMDLEEPEEEQAVENKEEVVEELTEQQKRQFQIQRIRADLDVIAEQLKALDEQKQTYIEQFKQAEERGDEEGKRSAQLAISGINQKMEPLRYKAKELYTQIQELEAQNQQEEQQQEEEAPIQADPVTTETSIDESGPARQPEQGKQTEVEGKDELETDDREKENENEQGEQVVGEARGIKALIEAFIRILQAITNNKNLLEGTRQKMLTNVKKVPRIEPKLTTFPEGTELKENSEQLLDEISQEIGGQEGKETAEIAQEAVEEAKEQEEPEEQQEDEAPIQADPLKEEQEQEQPEEKRPAWEIPEDQKDKINADSAEIAQEVRESQGKQKGQPQQSNDLEAEK